MLYYHLCLVSLAFLFPAQIVAQCSACTSYIAALKSCQKTSANVTQVGSTMDTDTVHCMCTSSSSYAEMNSCTGCTYSDSSLYEDLDALVLFAWTTTCDADEQYGDKQAAACWHSQPSDYVPCVSKTGGNTGGGSGTLSGGASSSATTLPQGTSGPTAATPSANVKSAGPFSLSMSIPLSIVLVAFGMVSGL